VAVSLAAPTWTALGCFAALGTVPLGCDLARLPDRQPQSRGGRRSRSAPADGFAGLLWSLLTATGVVLLASLRAQTFDSSMAIGVSSNAWLAVAIALVQASTLTVVLQGYVQQMFTAGLVK